MESIVGLHANRDNIFNVYLSSDLDAYWWAPGVVNNYYGCIRLQTGERNPFSRYYCFCINLDHEIFSSDWITCSSGYGGFTCSISMEWYEMSPYYCIMYRTTLANNGVRFTFVKIFLSDNFEIAEGFCLIGMSW